MSTKTWTKVTLIVLAANLLLIMGLMYIIDPFFHYHKGLDNFSYPLRGSDECYINDGIVSNFEYEGLIVGTSMTENFKNSEASELWGMNFVKCPKNGTFFPESEALLEKAFESDNNISVVIRSLDYTSMFCNTYLGTYVVMSSDKVSTNEYPEYLQNTNILDDVNYLLNKDVIYNNLIPIFIRTSRGDASLEFDDYGYWSDEFAYGKEAVFGTYSPNTPGLVQSKFSLDETDKETLIDNVTQNLTNIAKEHPETTFYYFFTPYSICYYEVLKNDGVLDMRLEVEKIAIEQLLMYDNIKVFSFSDDFSMTTNLDNYSDVAHYGEWINSEILQRMRKNQGLLTKDNYEQYLERIREFYSNYDYDSLRG